MARMLDCLVNYFGLDEDGRPGYRRYFCYHVVAGPGPAADAGLALVTTLAVHDRGERCTSCEAVHRVERGGPAAALAAALRYLDAYHGEDHLRKVQSDVRGLDGCPAPEGTPRPAARSARPKVGAR
jgi:hypothetical protein